MGIMLKIFIVSSVDISKKDNNETGDISEILFVKKNKYK